MKGQVLGERLLFLKVVMFIFKKQAVYPIRRRNIEIKIQDANDHTCNVRLVEIG